MKPFNLRVLIADDHPAVRIGIESTLRESQAVTVVGAARDSTEMMEMLKLHDCQILVSDYAMPGGLHGDGIALFALVRQRYPRLKIVVMTMLDNPGIIHSLLDIGVPCILNKADSVSHLLPAVHAAYASGRYLSPSMAEIRLGISRPAGLAHRRRAERALPLHGTAEVVDGAVVDAGLAGCPTPPRSSRA